MMVHHLLRIVSLIVALCSSLHSVSGNLVTVTVSETANGVRLTATGSLALTSGDLTFKSTTATDPNTSPLVSIVKSAGQLSQLAVLNNANQAYNTFTINAVNAFSFDCVKDGSASAFANLGFSNIVTVGFNNNDELIFNGDIGETTFAGGSLQLTSANLASTDFVPNSVCFIEFGSPMKRVQFVVEDIATASPSSAPTREPEEDEGCGNFGIGFVFCVIGEGFSGLFHLVVDIITSIF